MSWSRGYKSVTWTFFAAIERNLESEQEERVSADMRIRKSQVNCVHQTVRVAFGWGSLVAKLPFFFMKTIQRFSFLNDYFPPFKFSCFVGFHIFGYHDVCQNIKLQRRSERPWTYSEKPNTSSYGVQLRRYERGCIPLLCTLPSCRACTGAEPPLNDETKCLTQEPPIFKLTLSTL